MITLYQLTGYWVIPSPSPFCMKLETYLRMSNIPFRSVNILGALAAPGRKGPKKKIPFIEYEGQLLGDSSIIMTFLMEKFGVNIDAHLTPEQQAIGLAIQRMFEDHFFWTIVYSRWFDKLGWAVTKPEFYKGLPFGLRQVIPHIRKRKMGKVLYHQGMGRHSEKEIYQMGKHDLDAFAAILGEKRFLLGNEVTSFDAMAHGFLVNTIHVPFDIEIKKHAMTHSNIVSYVERINEIYYQNNQINSYA